MPPVKTLAIACALTVLGTAAARADVTFGLRVPLGHAIAVIEPAPAQQPQRCVSAPAQTFMFASQAANAFVIANARNRGSMSSGSLASNKSVAANLLTYAAIDFATISLTKHIDCQARAALYFGFGASALYNTSRTEFPQ